MKAIKKPLVSIVIPVYNGSNFLEQAINAAINQSYKNIEIIVVNDGSNDDGKTLSIIKKYKNITLIDKENGGVSSALNAAIKVAHGDYISWLSHDDLYEENKILHQIEYLSIHNNPKLIPYCKTHFINENGEKIHKLSIQAKRTKKITIDNSPFGVSFNGCSLLIPKEALNTPFNENFKYIQDTLKWFELMKNGYCFKCSGYFDSLMRVHQETVTNKHPELYVKEYTEFYLTARKEALLKKNYKA